jgi:iron complex transport system ATP-binding protein
MRAIELRDVSFSYGEEPFLSGFSLAVETKEFFGVIGPNGSGKTTLLRLMAGLLIPSAGEIRAKDRSVVGFTRRELARVVGFMPQESHFAFDFSVYEVVMMGRNPFLGRFERPGKPDAERAQAALEFTDAWGLRDKGINQLSGGEKQRVVLARTLAQEPEILLLDEPASQLDIAHQLQMLAILKRLNQQGITIVLLSHDLNLASIACSRILMLDRGRPAACDRPEKVLVPDLIERVYGVRPILERHPQTGTPQIVLPAVN